MPSSSTKEITFDFDATVARAGGDATVLVPLVEMVERNISKLTESLSEAVRSESAKDVEFAAHKLKSQCMTLGAEPASSLCAGLESDAKEGQLERIVALWERTHPVLQQTRRELLNELMRLKETA